MRAFLLYIDDWLSSKRIAMMDDHEERAYFRLLLCEAGEPDCSLPDNDQQLAIMSGMGRQWYKPTAHSDKRVSGVTSGQKIRACFVERDGRLVNERLHREWLHQQEVARKRSDVGKRGAEIKAAKRQAIATPIAIANGSANAKQTGKQNPTNDVWVCGCDSPSSSIPEKQENPLFDVMPHWERFCSEYPGFVNPMMDCRVFMGVIENQSEADLLWENLPLWKSCRMWQEGKIHHAENWISKRLYRVKPPAETNVKPARKLRSLVEELTQ